ncbi:MAG: hypothetical protein JWM34_1559 [Ilumatobacteraceae bacterium]|nr:hypothetical protein [Ilumatobacteraceae bacterium]
MARLSFRDRFFTTPVARALWSPLSILLLGAVAAVGIVVGLPIAAAIGIGVVAYGVKVLIAMPRNSRSGERIDPFVLKEPWRGYVQSAQSAKLRYDRTVDGTRDGPIKDHLKELGSRLDDGIEESWRIASRGNDIDSAIAQLSTAQAQRELDQLRAQPHSSSDDVTSTIQSLEAQISSGQRMQQVSSSTRDRLRLLDARFDELVARAVEVSVGSADSAVLGNDVDDLVNDLEGLRQAIDDTHRAEAGDLTEPGLALPDPGTAAPTPMPDTSPPQTRPQSQPPT